MTAKVAKQEPSVCPVYLAAGPDPFLVEQQVEHLIDRLVSEEERQTALWQPAADELPQIAEIFDELRTLPFLASRRVVLIRGAEEFIKSNRDALEKYLEHPSPTGVLILSVAGKADSRTKLTKAIIKMGGLIEAGALKPADLPRFACGYCQEHFGKGLQPAAAQMLVGLAGDETGRICSELEKLAVYTGSRKTITAEDVKAAVGQNRMFDAFEVIDALMVQKTEEALRRLRNLFETDKSAEYTVIGAFAYHFRRLFSARALLDKGQPQSVVAKRLGIWDWMGGRFFAQVHMVSLEQLGRILAQLGQIDHMMKTGKTTAPSSMERLVVQVAPLFSAK
jgi:DNA polymerase-3 subunit delta